MIVIAEVVLDAIEYICPLPVPPVISTIAPPKSDAIKGVPDTVNPLVVADSTDPLYSNGTAVEAAAFVPVSVQPAAEGSPSTEYCQETSHASAA
jgi:hypothetical protein